MFVLIAYKFGSVVFVDLVIILQFILALCGLVELVREIAFLNGE